MSASFIDIDTAASSAPTATFDALPLLCANCATRFDAEPSAICLNCLGPLVPEYDPNRTLPGRETIARRAPSLWRYREWLPFAGTPTLSLDSGFTPLVESSALARRLGVARAWVKNDAVSHPSLSFKDRVVSTAINAARAFKLGVIGCASTGNLANAVAAHAARAGLEAWIFIPHDLEPAKVLGTSIFAPRLVRVRGTYDDVNRLCAQVADSFGWGLVNVNLRAYYGEGSKTMAFEIVEQLGWRAPTAVVAPMAGGALVTKLHRGFGEFAEAGFFDGERPRIYGAQAAGCAPIVRLVERAGTRIEPEIPSTIARSLAIGNPADGITAARAITETGGWGAAVTDAELVAGIRLLAETTGIFAETAGGVTTAAALRLAQSGHFRPDDEVVLCITGNGLKTLDAVAESLPPAPVIAPRLSAVAALVESAA
ncbi:MAG TPA: threonine synthase [Gemmatimonadaceae bacterium]|nr:threonine synthase [Gemmatimonadaceae bacterium]